MIGILAMIFVIIIAVGILWVCDIPQIPDWVLKFVKWLKRLKRLKQCLNEKGVKNGRES